MLSRQLWKIALAEVPPDEGELREIWGSLVSYCNLYGTSPTEKSKESFSSFPDPHLMHPSIIPPTIHHYLNKLWQTRTK